MVLTAKILQFPFRRQQDLILRSLLDSLCERGLISLNQSREIRDFFKEEGLRLPKGADQGKIISLFEDRKRKILSAHLFEGRDLALMRVKREIVMMAARFKVDERSIPIAGLNAKILVGDKDILIKYLIFLLLAEISKN